MLVIYNICHIYDTAHQVSGPNMSAKFHDMLFEGEGEDEEF